MLFLWFSKRFSTDYIKYAINMIIDKYRFLTQNIHKSKQLDIL